MSLHTLPSFEAERRVRWQGVVCSVAGVLVSFSGVVVVGMVLDGMKPAPEPVYHPLFVGWNVEWNTGCRGLVCGPVKPIVRNPAGIPARPLRLDDHVRAGSFSVENFDVKIPKVEFTDTGWAEDGFE